MTEHELVVIEERARQLADATAPQYLVWHEDLDVDEIFALAATDVPALLATVRGLQRMQAVMRAHALYPLKEIGAGGSQRVD